jgi:uncharacterized protein YbjT (DUF2867 family)
MFGDDERAILSHDLPLCPISATGRQGSAVVRHLLQDKWRVRALTTDPSSTASRALGDRGAELYRVDTEDINLLRRALHGVHGVFNVQNPMTSSFTAEVRQGRNVAEAAAESRVSHVVYGAAGVGEQLTGSVPRTPSSPSPSTSAISGCGSPCSAQWRSWS